MLAPAVSAFALVVVLACVPTFVQTVWSVLKTFALLDKMEMDVNIQQLFAMTAMHALRTLAIQHQDANTSRFPAMTAMLALMTLALRPVVVHIFKSIVTMEILAPTIHVPVELASTPLLVFPTVLVQELFVTCPISVLLTPAT